MRDLPLNALRAFAAVCSQGGVRPAARELGVAHSSVSRHVAELEAWLGVPLTRAPGGRVGLALTPQGEALGRATLACMQEISRTAEALREARSPYSVTISAAPSFASRWLLPRLPELEKAHPRIEVSVMVEQKLDDLEVRGIDLAIRMGAGPWPDVRCEPLMDDALYPVMSPAFWKKSREPDQPKGLVGLHLLHDRDPHAAWAVWREAYGPLSLDVRHGPRFASSDLVLRAAVQGQGVALARDRLARDDVASGALLRPLASLAVKLEHAYWLVRPKHARLRAATVKVIEWLKQAAH